MDTLRPVFLKEISQLPLEKVAISKMRHLKAWAGRFIKPKGYKGLSRETKKGLRVQAFNEPAGPRSFLMWLPRIGAEKAISHSARKSMISASTKNFLKTNPSFTRTQAETLIRGAIANPKTVAKSGPMGASLAKAMKGLDTQARVAGPRKVRTALWKKVDRPLHKLNIGMGERAGMIPGLKKLFLEKHNLPVRRHGEKLMKEVSIPSFTAPVTKALDLATPVIVGVSLEKGLEKLKKRGKNG